MSKKSRIRIKGNDRGLMMICRDIRRRWMQYGENRKEAKKNVHCVKCLNKIAEEFDHIEPVGARPRVFQDLGSYAERMFWLPCQGLCKECHKSKTKKERRKK